MHKGMLKIRLALAEDAEKLVARHIEVWKSSSKYLSGSSINPEMGELLKLEAKERLRQQIHYVNTMFSVADEEGEIIRLVQERTYAGVSYLGFLGVKKEHGGRGIGESLLNRFIEEERNKLVSKGLALHFSTAGKSRRALCLKSFVPEGF